MKRKEIEWWSKGNGTVTGRHNGVIFWISRQGDTEENGYTVRSRDTRGTGRTISTAGYREFTWEEAVEFCQKIAAGEINLDAMRAEFQAEDMAREKKVVQAAVAEAKAFREHLERAGISYTTLLHLTALQQEMGGLAHNILLGYEHGEGWPYGT